MASPGNSLNQTIRASLLSRLKHFKVAAALNLKRVEAILFSMKNVWKWWAMPLLVGSTFFLDGCANSPKKIDYSDNPYIGADWSFYFAGAFDANNKLISMSWGFWPKGYGIVGGSGSSSGDWNSEFTFTISGTVNVSIKFADGTTDYGHFTTNTNGQAFVYHTTYFYRS